MQSVEAIKHLVGYPAWLTGNNWVHRFDEGRSDKTFDVMLQLVHSHDETGAHFDNNACDTWMKLLAGKVLVATWSLDDALAHGTAEFCNHTQHDTEYEAAKAMDWVKLREMPSGRLFWLSQGDVLVLPAGKAARAPRMVTGPTTPHRAAGVCRVPHMVTCAVPHMVAGTFHYVYTVLKKLVVAGDFCNASGWRARVRSAEEWREKQGRGKKDKDAVELVQIFVHGLEKVELPRARKMLERGEAPSPARRIYLKEILAWEEELRKEAQEEELRKEAQPAPGAVRRALERPDVKEALTKVRECLVIPQAPKSQKMR